MPLLRNYVTVTAQLTLPESVRLAIVKLAVDQGRIATAMERHAAVMEALLKKLTDDDDPNAVTVDFSAGPVREQTR